MSIYEARDKSAYEFRPEPAYCENQWILKWWSASHDGVLSKAISSEHWLWPLHISDKIVAITPPQTIDAWTAEDPLCSEYAWYNILMNFAIARADRLGLLKAIRKPNWKVCPLCGNRFIEDSLPAPFVARLGIERLDFCAPCMTAALFHSGNDSLSGDEVCRFLRNLFDLLQRVPAQDFGMGINDLRGMDTKKRLSVLGMLKGKPSKECVKRWFGSWKQALSAAGIPDRGRAVNRAL